MSGSLPARLVRACIDVLIPDPCGLCGLPSPGGSLCTACTAELPWIKAACPRCGLPPSAGRAVTPLCAGCQRRPPPYLRAFAPLDYVFPVDAMIKAFKFGRRLELARPLANCALPWLLLHRQSVDALLPVPLHRFRNASRGFNQAEELVRCLHQTTGIPVRHCLRRARRTRSQSGLNARERRKNIRDAFLVSGKPRCRHALLVDDVMTTTATVCELSRVLLAAGVETVSVLAVARASLPSQASGGSKV